MHGDIDYPATIVLTRTDYANYQRRHAEFVDELSGSINDHTMLFIGFGLRDPNFRRIYGDARSFYDSTKRQAYAIMSGITAVERGLWEDEKLTIIPVMDYKEVPLYLNQLHKKVSRWHQ